MVSLINRQLINSFYFTIFELQRNDGWLAISNSFHIAYKDI